ncbi:hypothetical protein [Lysinibacillus sp. RC79]|uniref:hypothetical protein n=1 Tax=Lysinibacillus sp. RC79 TaxID=3156296 RepID=UPI003511ADFE
MKKITTILTALFAIFIVFGSMGKASASELDQELKKDFSSTLFTETSIEKHEHEHDAFVHASITGYKQITVFAVCNHVGTLKETKHVGTHSKCGGPLYKVFCKPCGKFTGKTICLCK